jgi:putative hydrolase of the HAD superfamily
VTPKITSPRLILFDFVGTLAEVRGGVGAAYARFARAQGADLDAARLERGFREAFRAVFLEAGASPADSGAARTAWSRVIAAAFAHAGDEALGHELAPSLYAWFATAEPWHVYPEVPEALRALRAAGIQVGILSNFDDRLPALLEALDLAKHLDGVTLPEHAAAPKPAPAIFECALARHGVAAAEAWMVGDSEAEDILPARALGLCAFQLARAAASEPAPATYPTLDPVVRRALRPRP